MKQAILLFCYTLLTLNFAIAQSKRAEIEIHKFQPVNENYYSLNCSVEFLHPYNSRKNYLFIFLLGQNNKAMQVVSTESAYPYGKEYYLINEIKESYTIELYTSDIRKQKFTLYPVLVEANKDTYDLQRKITTLNNEFFYIQDVLDYLYKLNLTPLTYTTIDFPN